MNNERSKVVHISTVHPPLDTRIYYKQCLSLAKHNFDVSLIVSENNDTKYIDKDMVNVYEIKKEKNRLTRIIKSCWSALKVARTLNAEVYHLHDPELLFIARLLKRKDNIVIYDVHEDYETSIKQKKYLKKPFNLIVAKLYNILEKLLIKNIDICIAEKYYKEKYQDSVEILNYPIIENSSVSQEFNAEPEINLIYTGGVTLDRGALNHAKLPSLDENITVTFVGICPQQIAEEIYKINKGKNNIMIKGINKFVPRQQIDEEYKKAKWLAGLALFPPTDHYMRKELTKFFEYMNAGIPIICSNFPHWKNFVEKYQCGIAVDPYDDEEILKAIKYLKSNPDKAKQMGQNGKRAVEKELNWNVEEKKLVNWYDDLLSQNKK